MAINDGFYRYKNVLKKQLKLVSRIYLSTAIVLSPIFFINSANASTLAGGSGWRVASTVANGVGVTVNGVKDVMVNGAKKTMTGVANVTPTASQVGKFMGKNLGAAAVIGAMDLLLDGVDYVLDPANNSVTYNSKCSTNCQFLYQLGTRPNTRAPTQQQVCQNLTNYWMGGETTSSYYSASKNTCERTYTYFGSSYTDTSGETIQQVANPNYDQSKEEEKKTVPLSEIGQQVIDQAETEVRTGNPAVPIATPVTQAAATAVVGEAATDETQARPITAELDKSAAIPTTETAVGEIAPPTTNPQTGEVKPGSISLDFPVFCSWAPSMCVLADKVQEAITDAREWAKNDENQVTDNELPEIKEIDIDALDTSTFTGVAGCPAPIAVPLSFGDGGEIEISYEPICQLAEKWSFVAPMIGFLSGAMIIVGVGRKGEDGEI
jgi:hypothetical protein